MAGRRVRQWAYEDLSNPENWDGFIGDVVMAVEAFGSLQQAIDAGLLVGLRPTLIAILQEDVIPPTRGGVCPCPHALDDWEGMVKRTKARRGEECIDAAREFGYEVSRYGTGR